MPIRLICVILVVCLSQCATQVFLADVNVSQLTEFRVSKPTEEFQMDGTSSEELSDETSNHMELAMRGAASYEFMSGEKQIYLWKVFLRPTNSRQENLFHFVERLRLSCRLLRTCPRFTGICLVILSWA
jgi:hypothetical protein